MVPRRRPARAGLGWAVQRRAVGAGPPEGGRAGAGSVCKVPAASPSEAGTVRREGREGARPAGRKRLREAEIEAGSACKARARRPENL